MSSEKIFGGSLYALAEEEGISEEILSDLRSVTRVFYEHPDYMKILDSPQIERGDLMQILNEDFLGRINKYTLNFIKILCQKRMVHHIAVCTAEYERLYNEKNNIRLVKVTTAKPLSETLAQRLVKKLEARTGARVVLEKHIDEKCIGGIIIETDGRRIDSSVKSELEELKKAITV